MFPLKIGITMGDPSGVGPEVIIKALSETPERNWQPVILGVPEILEAASQSCGIEFKPKILESPDDLSKSDAVDPLLLPIECELRPDDFEVGEISAACGDAAFAAIREGIRLCRQGALDGLCTAPIHKAALQMAGHVFPGHTEILKAFTQSKQVAMCLVGGGLRTVPLTTHVPLRQVAARISEDQIFNMLQLLHSEIPLFGVQQPRIGVAGLNPHAGDLGALGNEDEEIIRPAVERARAKKICSHKRVH